MIGAGGDLSVDLFNDDMMMMMMMIGVSVIPP
jgi:hypothetical protein